MALKCVLFVVFILCFGCSSQTELIKPEGEWRRINTVNPLTNQFIDAEKEVKHGQ